MQVWCSVNMLLVSSISQQKTSRNSLLLLLHEFTEIGRQNLNQKLQHYLGFGDVGRTIGIQQCLKIWTPPHCYTLTNLQN
jgi:hypothetical protein